MTSLDGYTALISGGARGQGEAEARLFVERGAAVVIGDVLVDQGTADGFLEEQLKPQLLQEACDRAGVALDLRMQEGYDHSYYFISSFMEDHLRFHAANLAR